MLNTTGQWSEASRHRELLLAYLQQESGAGTLLDTRRTRDYDADNLVDQYLNQKNVQVPPWHSASPMVFAQKLRPWVNQWDVMLGSDVQIREPRDAHIYKSWSLWSKTK